MKSFSLTAHARTVTTERSIRREWLEHVLLHPEKTEPDRNDPDLKHALGHIDDYENRVLRVVYNDSVEPVRIVTAYFDRAMKGQL